MKSQIRSAFAWAVLCSVVLASCAPSAPATPQTVVETQIVVQVQTQQV